MKSFPCVPTSASWMRLPVGGTLILLMLPDHFANWWPWVWPVLWTLWGFVWVAYVIDIVTREHIPDAKWREVFK